MANNSSHSTLHIGYKEKHIEEMVKTFLGLQINNLLNDKNIRPLIPKLSEAYYAMRLIIHISNIKILQSIDYALPSVLKYGIMG
jgi:hypothetical protein